MKQHLHPKAFARLALFLFLGLVIVQACQKDDTDLPPNPYDDIDYGGGDDSTSTLDPTSFVGLHSTIFKTRCAVGGCHDGHFEPDFRTVQSSYSTLVYHSIIKNNADSTFEYRVVPFEKENSVLYERITNCCFVNQDDRMPQDNIGTAMEQELINNIGNWIDNGAKDMFDNPPELPNTAPKIIGYIAADNTFQTDYSTDINNRVGNEFFNPFMMPNNTDVAVAVFVEDDRTAVADLTVNELRISDDPDDFSGAQALQGTYLTFNDDEFYLFNFNSSIFNDGNQKFMRFFTNDGDQPTDTHFPTDNLPIQYKSYWSFIVTP